MFGLFAVLLCLDSLGCGLHPKSGRSAAHGKDVWSYGCAHCTQLQGYTADSLFQRGACLETGPFCMSQGLEQWQRSFDQGS